MDTVLTTAIVSAGGTVIASVFGMFFMSNQLGKRIEDSNQSLGKRIEDSNQSLGKRIDDLRGDIKELRSEFYAFKDVINGKLTTLDTDIAKLMDRHNSG